MSGFETVATGRAKRSTAGNRMRELLERAHQEDDDDMFAEVEDDEEFLAPQEVRDVFLEDFADTDDEVELDEEEEEQALRREERKKAKGKSKAVYDPLAAQPRPKQIRFADPSSSTSTPDVSLLDPNLDPTNMAPSTLVLALRKQRREAKRAGRSEARRSNLRASTLRTETEILEKEKYEKDNPNRKGRRAQHETGEIRGLRPMTQDELIAAALEEEERNKESLRDWLKREEEKRELRRVGRKRVRGPRWTWISRTVGKLVEVVGEEADNLVGRDEAEPVEVLPEQAGGAEVQDHSAEEQPDKETQPTSNPSAPVEVPYAELSANSHEVPNSANPEDPPTKTIPCLADQESATHSPIVPLSADISLPTTAATSNLTTEPAAETATVVSAVNSSLAPSDHTSPPKSTTRDPPPSSVKAESEPQLPVNPSQVSASKASVTPSAIVPKATSDDPESSKYMRNYLILSQIPGGLPAELKIVLGEHVEWDEVEYIPSRNRPINRRPPTCPFTGLPAKYRHPTTMIQYATAEGYKEIEALLQNRYVWNEESSCWMGGEEDVHAEGVEEIAGWWEAVNGGWLGGIEIPDEEGVEEPQIEDEVPIEVEEVQPLEQPKTKGKGRGNNNKRKRGHEDASVSAGATSMGVEPLAKKAKGKAKKR
ncbi:hypothetical protein IAR55_002649 [Kwoniella newhampshirensis]|uniref:Vps72/YL1 C-terminal domain-containing protein n=1 Tax=Kwoniella newhampshirensis TaxID=1651941 RepID=A0AAW0YZU4_9TREE